jgi:hypothetical protein
MRITIVLLTSLLISACSPYLVPPSQPTQISSEVGPKSSSTPIATEMDKMISIAITDLASRFSVDPKDIRLLSAEAQVWPDAALGCPRPGEVYAQETVPGYRLHLKANGQEFVYHTNTDRTVILCVEEELPSFLVTPGEIDDDRPWMPVD